MSIGSCLRGTCVTAGTSLISTSMMIFTGLVATPLVTKHYGKVVLKLISEEAQNAISSALTNFSVSGAFGDKLGQEISEFFNGTFRHLRLQEGLGDFVSREINGSFHTLREHINVTALGELIIKDVHQLADRVRETALVELKLLRENAQEIFSDVLQDFTLKSLPWIALGSAIAVGTPLAVFYTYHTLKHKIGRPKLAQERRSYNFNDRMGDAVRSVFNWSLNSAKHYLQWSLGASAVVSLGAAFLTFALKAESFFNETCPSNLNWYSELAEDIWCSLSKGVGTLLSKEGTEHILCTSSASNAFSLENIFIACQCIGISAIAYHTLKGFSEHVYKNWGVQNAKPIFNDSIKETIEDIIDSIKNLKKNGGYFQNVLLYGPGGTGKTMFSKYIARNSGMNYIMMSGGDLAQYIKRGEHVTELNKLFEDAKNSSGPTIVFIDEAESLCRDRSQINRDELFELLNAFLNQTGEPSNKIMLILATNRPEDIDEAVLSRMDNKIEIGPPEFNERKNILKMYLTHFFSRREITNFFPEETLDQISHRTEGLTGRTLFKMLNALSTKKKCSKENRLSHEMIKQVVLRFVDQEHLIKRLTSKNIV